MQSIERTWNETKVAQTKKFSFLPDFICFKGTHESGVNGNTPLRISLQKFCSPDAPSPCLTRGFASSAPVVVSSPGPGSPDEVQVSTCPSPSPALQAQQSRWLELCLTRLGRSDSHTASLPSPTQNLQATAPQFLVQPRLKQIQRHTHCLGAPVIHSPLGCSPWGHKVGHDWSEWALRGPVRAKPTYTTEEEVLVSSSFTFSLYSRHLQLPNSKSNPLVLMPSFQVAPP